MNSLTLLILFSSIFILLGGYTLFTGLKRIRQARTRGMPLTWYKQINLLIGIEYILLALVFLANTAVRTNTLPQSLNSILVPIYYILLLAAAVLAGLVIRQGIINTRTMRAQSRSSAPTVMSNGTSAVPKQEADIQYTQERAANQERRRQRRRNAASARRRRAGKA